MSEYDEHIHDEELERYLDGLLTDEEKRAFEQRMQTDETLCATVESNQSFEARVTSAFVPPNRSVSDIESLLADNEIGATEPSSTFVEPSRREQRIGTRAANRRRMLIGLASACAALLAGVMVFQQTQKTGQVTAYFKQRPLPELYNEVVDQGFRPYYFCEDDERFARTFRKRQSAPLALSDTPKDRRMVGLSYLGGLSRDTTAMLAYVKDQPVVVFIDRKEFDSEEVLTKVPGGTDELYVHRAELGDLVLYEVSPFDSIQMATYLSLAK